ncbi:MAG: tyrosine-type recombinase/integrase, partial [Hyphomicrobiales bacterium]|nr:tyrosine-type recombinase/integrase [Hyphomicrobiales bacterium]
MMASTVAHNVSSSAAPLSANSSRNPLCLRARASMIASAYKYKAALSVAYGAGLRVSEVANLKVSDIDRERMTLRVEQGKGQRDRTVML